MSDQRPSALILMALAANLITQATSGWWLHMETHCAVQLAVPLVDVPEQLSDDNADVLAGSNVSEFDHKRIWSKTNIHTHTHTYTRCMMGEAHVTHHITSHTCHAIGKHAACGQRKQGGCPLRWRKVRIRLHKHRCVRATASQRMDGATKRRRGSAHGRSFHQLEHFPTFVRPELGMEHAAHTVNADMCRTVSA